jgi:hypothetical protein
MAYIGKTPAASPLTSADITDGIIVNVDVASGAAIDDEKIAPPYYSAVSALPAAGSHHGRVAHAHNEGMMYYSHGDAWIALAKDTAKQDVDAGLTSISGLTTAADKMIYTTASDTYAVADLTAAGRELLNDATTAAQRTTLGLGTAATTAATAYATSAQGTKADNAAALANDQTFTGANRGTITVDNDGSFDLAVTNNFKCTPTANITSSGFTFTNVSAATGQSGNIIFVNGSNYTVSINTSVVKIKSGDATTISTTGTYWLSYICDGTLVYVVVSGKLE